MRISPSIRIVLAAGALAVGACSPDAEAPVSFRAEVKPVLDRYCLDCHRDGAPGFEQSGLSVATHADLMRGTRYGTVVIPGDAANSNLIVLVEGRADPAIAMPHDGTRLFGREIETLRTWIDQGAADN